MVDQTQFIHSKIFLTTDMTSGFENFQAVHGNDLRFKCPIDSY